MPMIGHRLGGLRPKFHSCRHFDSVLGPLARSSRSGARTFFPIGGRRRDGSVRRCTQGASWRGGTDCAAPRLPRRRLPRGGHLLTLPLFSFSLREAGRERSLHCRWLAQCSDRGGRLLGLHSHPSRREGTRRRNHDRHSPRGRVEGGGDSVAAEGRRLPRHPAQCHSPPTACAVEPGRACRRRRRQCTVVHTVGDGCWHLYWAGDVAVGDGSAVACFCCWTGCSGLRRCCFRRWWCEAASSSEAGFNVVHGISLVLFLFFAVAQR